MQFFEGIILGNKSKNKGFLEKEISEKINNFEFIFDKLTV